MNRKWKYIFSIALAALLLQTPLWADGVSKIAQSGMKWLSIPIGARGVALGSAYTAMANDASAVFWNPAGVAFAEGGHLFLNQNQWIADITVNAGALTWNSGNWGVFGLNFATVDWGVIHGTQRANNEAGFVETGEFSPDHFAVGLNYARKVSDKFAIGGNVKFLHEDLFGEADVTEGSFDAPTGVTANTDLLAFDFGTVYYTGYRDLRIAMSFQNFSKEVVYREEYFSLPLTFRVGMAMGLTNFFAENSPHNITLAVDAMHPRDFSERMHFGMEYSFHELVFLRGGYKTNYDQEDFTLGAGLQYDSGNLALGIDYSYVAFENFDGVHMFSLDFKF